MKFHLIIANLALALMPAMGRADVLVFAAASLKGPLDQIAERHEGVTVSYAGSGTLARQIIMGAPADVVLLANQAWMDEMRESGAVQTDTITDFASNALVVIGPAGSDALSLTADAVLDRLDGGRMAVGLTNAVPAGIYARQSLEALGLWSDLSAHLAEVDSVRAALVLVSRGQAPLGIVYQSDLRASDRVALVASLPPETHQPIRYTAALTPTAGPKAAAFLDEVLSENGQRILAQAGFLPPAAGQH